MTILLSFTQHRSNEEIAQSIRENTLVLGSGDKNDRNTANSLGGNGSSARRILCGGIGTKNQQKKKKATTTTQQKQRITGLAFYEIEFDEQISSALKDFFRSLVVTTPVGISNDTEVDYTDDDESKRTAAAASNQSSSSSLPPPTQTFSSSSIRVLSEFFLYSCPGNKFLQGVLQVAIELDVVQRYHIKGLNENTRRNARRRIARWMEIPSSERSSTIISSFSRRDDDIYIQPSLKPFGGIKRGKNNGRCNNNNNNNSNLRGFAMSCFKLSTDDVKFLRNGGILSSWSSNNGSGGLEELSFSNVTFVDHDAVKELGDALSDLSTNSGSKLRELSLVGCNLDDDQLERIVRSLMTSTTVKTKTTSLQLSDNDDKKSSSSSSSISKLNLSFNKCGEKCLHALGSWLLGGVATTTNTDSFCSCSLESLQISNNIEDDDRTRRANNNNNTEEQNDNNENENNSISSGFKLRHFLQNNDDHNNNNNMDDSTKRRRRRIDANTTLKRLRLDGNPSIGGSRRRRATAGGEEGGGRIGRRRSQANNDADNNIDDDKSETTEMGYLGRFVSNYLIALEELDLDSSGITDFGLAKFASASSSSSSSNFNRSLRLLRLSGNNSLTSISCESVILLLKRYPMLRSITSGSNSFKWTKGYHENQIRHLINVNDSGRVLLNYYCNNKNNTNNKANSNNNAEENHNKRVNNIDCAVVPVSLWPKVFERINRRFLHEGGGNPLVYKSCSIVMDPTNRAANGIYYLIRNNVEPVLLSRNNNDNNVHNSNNDDDDDDDRKKRRRRRCSCSSGGIDVDGDENSINNTTTNNNQKKIKI